MIQKSLYKSLLFSILSLFFIQPVSAQFQEGINIPEQIGMPTLSGTTLISGSNNYVEYSNTGEQSSDITTIVTFKILENTNTFFVNNFTATTELNLELTDQNNTVTNPTLSLNVAYDVATGAKYKVMDYRVFKGYKKVKVTIGNISIVGGSGWDPKKVLEVQNEMRVIKFFNLSANATDLVAAGLSPAAPGINDDELPLSWSFPVAARENMTQLEWAFVENEMLGFYNNNFDFLFKNNSTRIDLDYNASGYIYKIPLLFPQGKLFYRVRAVQRKANGTLITGPWSVVSSTEHFVDIPGHENKLNWQSSTSFAEDGKSKTVIQYLDGTMRGRQTVTKDNSTGNTIVGETIYDLQGRPNIQILPTPTIDNTIKYFNGFNRFAGMQANDDPSKYFDLTPAGVSKCLSAPKLDTFGNGRYYSPKNDWLTTEAKSKFIPDAEGYAFTETRYTDDATQRVTAQGGIGINHQLNANHAIKYYYGKPSQPELDGLFGTEAGDASHYSKNMVVDANGEVSLKYFDMNGRTVATAVTAPTNPGVDAILGADYPLPANLLRNNLLTPATNLIQGNSIISTSTILNPSPLDYSFTYSLTPAILNFSNCNNQPVCFDCKYDLEISIRDENCSSNPPFIRKYNNLQIVTGNTCTTSMLFTGDGISTPTNVINFHQVLGTGSYVVTKTLTINDSVFQIRRDSAWKELMCRTKDSIYHSVYDSLSLLSGCNVPATAVCDTCLAHLGTYNIYKVKYLQSISPLVVTDSAIHIQYSIDSTQCSLACNTGGFNPELATLKGLRAQMLADMKPYTGQYALDTVLDNTRLEAKFNIFASQYLPGGAPYTLDKPYFRHPKSETGSLFYFDDYNNPDNTVAANIIDTLSKNLYAGIFNDSWLNSLIVRHPEYTKLQYAETVMKPSYDWLDRMQNCSNYADAVTNHFIDPINYDPYLLLPSTLADKNALIRYINTSVHSVQAAASAWQIANGMVTCSTTDSLNRYGCFLLTNATGLDAAVTTTAQKNEVWENFKTLYLSYRNEMVTRYINAHATAALSAPDMATLIAEDKQLIFAENQDIAAQNGAGQWWQNLTNISNPVVDTNGLGAYINTFGLDNCEGMRPFWRMRLLQCEVLHNYLLQETHSDSVTVNNIINSILDGMVSVCHNSITAHQPYGASNVNPSYGGNPANFEQVINDAFALNGINTIPGNNYFCNPYTIDFPRPYGFNPQLHVNNTNIIDSCGCSRFAALKLEAGADSATFASMNQFLLSNYQDSLTYVVWQGLQKCANSYIDTCVRTSIPASDYGIIRRQVQEAGSGSVRPPVDDPCPPPVLYSLSLLNATASNNIGVSYYTDPASTNCNIIVYDELGNFYNTSVTCGSSYTVISLPLCHRYFIYITSGIAKAGCYGASETLKIRTTCEEACTKPVITSAEVVTPNPSPFDQTVVVNYTIPPGSSNCALKIYGYNSSTDVYTLIDTHSINCASFQDSVFYLYQCKKYRFTIVSDVSPTCLGMVSDTFALDHCYQTVCQRKFTHVLLPEFAVIPAFLNCGYVKPCITCGKLDLLSAEFRALFPDYTGVPYLTAATDAQMQQNALWARFLNYRTGFSKNALDYMDAYKTCHSGNGCASGSGANILIVNNRVAGVPEYKARTAVKFVPGFASNPSDFFVAHIDPLLDTCIGTPMSPSAIAICNFAVPVNAPYPHNTNPCRDVETQAQFIAQLMYESIKDAMLAKFDSLYKSKCLAAQSQETFYADYATQEYHYTLYYYDQAGNLVKTLPPAAVKPYYNSAYLANIISFRNAGNDLVNPNNIEELATEYRYNSLNQVISQKTPDAGLSKFWYDKLGRLAVSQNAQQALDGRYSYTMYDALGRITQVGQKPQSTPMTQAISQNETALQQWLDNTGTGALKEQITRTVYDVPYFSGEQPGTLEPVLYQKNLRNKVSYTQLINTEPSDFDTNPYAFLGRHSAATYYSYDIHGNVDTLVQDLNEGYMKYKDPALSEPALSAGTNLSGNRHKKLVYNYDLVSGKVNSVSYQPGFTDQFYHKYSYDAQNRLTEVQTSHDSVYWEIDATYDYYRHGPLSRMELGVNKVQGLDYAYTIQGWLKGVNSTSVLSSAATAGGGFDMGLDGAGNNTPARDAFGYSLNYFAGDYKPLGGINIKPFVAIAGILPEADDGLLLGRDLWNGNIRAMMVNIPQLGEAKLYAYRYDQLSRLKSMSSFNGFNNTTNLFANANTPAASPDYKERIKYDPNGNIRSYLRRGAGSLPGGLQMDSLVYKYEEDALSNRPLSNRLRYVYDDPNYTAHYTEDIDSQTPLVLSAVNGDHNISQPGDNYGYDAIGNLIRDKKEHIDEIRWNVYGKINGIVKDDGTIIKYTYDAVGNRISKSVDAAGAGNLELTFYIRDATGNVMGIYNKSASINSGRLTQSEISEYGSSRLGVWNLNRSVASIASTDYTTYEGVLVRGNKNFELSNHLGNVLATVSDKLIGIRSGTTDTTSFKIADVVTANDYYPFGMQMPGRKFAVAAAFRYGFNGKENDDDVQGEGNQQDYGMRVYDSRIGRFLSVDPLAMSYPWNSVYSFSEDDPINFIDLDGLEKGKKQTLTFPVYQHVNQIQITNLVATKSAHTDYRKLNQNKCTIGSREYGYIATYEDLTLQMYDADGDPSGNATIGFGYLIHHGKISGNAEAIKLEEPFKDGITIDKAIDLFIENIHEKEGYVNKYIVDMDMRNTITARQYTALVDIALNMGQSNAKKVLKVLKEEGAAKAAEFVRGFNKKGGLKNRREFEALLLENQDFITKGDMEAQNAQKKKEEAKAKLKAKAESKKSSTIKDNKTKN